jgi:dTMP kinase
MTNPKVISLEGIDGSGKSTVAMWLKERLEALGIEAILLREPGSTPIGETLRNII